MSNKVIHGTHSWGNSLPELKMEEVLQLIIELDQFTKVKLKKNINRIIK